MNRKAVLRVVVVAVGLDWAAALSALADDSVFLDSFRLSAKLKVCLTELQLRLQR
jgi:hypothetical protein